ncbi:MAG: hypothetical protein ACUVUR_01500, partial [bacterium]
PGIKAVLSPGVPLKKVLARKVYRVATTFSFLSAHPEIRFNGFELSERQLWEYASDILQAQGKR